MRAMIFVVLLLSAPAAAQDILLAPLGSKVVGAFEISETYVPLPVGEWVLAARGDALSNNAARTASAYLIEVRDGKLSRAVVASTSVRGTSPGNGWVRNRGVCDRTNVLVNVSDSNFNSKDANCFSINHLIVASPSSVSPVLQQFFDYLAANNLITPQIRIASEHWIANAGPYISVAYYFNPEIVGLDTGPFERWDSADWNVLRITGFPDKKAFAAKVEAFGRAIHKDVELGIRRRLQLGKWSDAQVAGWPVPVAVAPAPSMPTVPSVPSQSPADRLRALEDLKSRGVITESEFQQQRQRIIDGI
jgi:hypothetical protein